MVTYFNILFIFILPPIIALSTLLKFKKENIEKYYSNPYLSLFVLIIVAVIYTTPWDNYLVKEGIWFYDSNLVHGFTIGYVPVEEYLFFVMETLLVGLLLLSFNPKEDSEMIQIYFKRNLIISSIIFVAWILSVLLFYFGSPEFTYLSLILGWALIPIMIQTMYGADILIYQKRIVLSTIILSTIYLSLVDAYAISSGTWTIGGDTSLVGLKLGIMPLEEILFFFITAILVTFGMILATNSASRKRLQYIKKILTSKRLNLSETTVLSETH